MTPDHLRGPSAIAAVAALIAASFALAGGVSYAARSREPDGPATVSAWAAQAVRPPGELPAGRGPELIERYRCLACHSIGGRGALVGPALDGVRERKTRAEIVSWLEDPQAVRPGTIMPTYPFRPLEKELLADHLLTLKPRPENVR